MRLSILFMLLCLFSQVKGQNQYPSVLKWKEIKTPHFKIVYPEGMQQKGAEAASVLERSYEPVKASLQTNPKPITLILNNQSVVSNGFVTLAPRYMCFYTTPFQDVSVALDGSDWIQLLALHEYRHVAQFSKLESGFTDIMGDVFGDFGKAVFMNISTPRWFFEGDAIYSETSLSTGGRGRQPAFFRGTMANELNLQRFSYDKAYLGSYKHFVPNHYHLGYLLTSHYSQQQGPESWLPVLNHSSKYSFWPLIFSGALKKSTGKNLDNSYQAAMDYYHQLWQTELLERKAFHNDSSILPGQSFSCYTEITYPFITYKGDVLALKYGLNDISTLVLFQNGSEKELCEINPSDRIHSNGHQVVWCESYPDMRWEERNWSDIKIYDIYAQTLKRLTVKRKLFAPALSPDGNLVAAIEFAEEARCYLVIVDAVSGSERNRFRLAENTFFRMPSWSADQQKIVLSASRNQLKALAVFSLTNESLSFHTPWTSENLTNPVFHEQYLIFNSPVSGFDEVHALDTLSGQRYLLFASEYGVYNAQLAQGNKLVYQKYTHNGTRAEVRTIDRAAWIKVNANNLAEENYLNQSAPFDSNLFSGSQIIGDTSFQEKAYSPLLKSLHIHSWSPRIGYQSLGFQVFSNDILNTTSLQAGIDYYPNIFAHREFARLVYARYFPVFSVEFSYGNRYNTDLYEPSLMKEKIVDLSVALPFNFSRSTWLNRLMVESGYYFGSQQYQDSIVPNAYNMSISALHAGFEFSSRKLMAPRNIYPRLGAEWSVNYIVDAGESTTDGSQFTNRNRFYLPGIGPNHSLQARFVYDHFEGDYHSGMFIIDQNAEPVRGFEQSIYQTALRGTLLYALPLFYPDSRLGSVFYLKRIFADGFYDWGLYSYESWEQMNHSVGFDLNFEFHFLRLPVPLLMGIRYSHLLDQNSYALEFTFFQIAF